MQMRTHWYLGFLALVGLWKLPDVWAFVTAGQGNWTVLLNLLWFGWLHEFIPVRTSEKGDM